MLCECEIIEDVKAREDIAAKKFKEEGVWAVFYMDHADNVKTNYKSY